MKKVIIINRYHYIFLGQGDNICGAPNKEFATGHVEQVTCKRCLNIMANSNLAEESARILKGIEALDEKTNS